MESYWRQRVRQSKDGTKEERKDGTLHCRRISDRLLSLILCRPGWMNARCAYWPKGRRRRPQDLPLWGQLICTRRLWKYIIGTVVTLLMIEKGYYCVYVRHKFIPRGCRFTRVVGTYSVLQNCSVEEVYHVPSTGFVHCIF